jgi:hypothetical protein
VLVRGWVFSSEQLAVSRWKLADMREKDGEEGQEI